MTDLKVKLDRKTRISLLLRAISTFGDVFDGRAFVGIPIEKLEETWEDFRKNIHTLHLEYYPSSEGTSQ